MPQMMPIAWIQMYFLINSVLFIIMAKTYFSSIKMTPEDQKLATNVKNMNWKW